MIPILVAVATSIAAPSASNWAGEEMVWDVSYLGVVAGQAGARAVAAPDGSLVIEGWCRNATWYERFYRIDDFIRSTWVPGQGSARYETRFREGRFHQDQDMRLLPDGVEVQRRQRFEDGKEEEWREWTTRYEASPGAEDPASAFYAMRLLEGEGPWTIPLFTGKKTWPLVVESTGRERVETEIGEFDARTFDLHSSHRGMLEQRGRLVVWLREEDGVPVRMVARTNFGSIRADLVAYTPPADRDMRAAPKETP